MKKYDISYENQQKAKQLNKDYTLLLDDIIPYVIKFSKNSMKADILLSSVLNQMIEHQSKINNPKQLYNNLKDYIYKIDKNIHYKSKIKEIKHNDIQRFTMNGLRITMCGYIVVLFLKEILTQHFLIHLYVDSIVAIVAFYITLHNLINTYTLIKKHQLPMNSFIIIIMGLIVSIVLGIITAHNPFDITFLVLVIAYITTKKMLEKEMTLQ